MPDISPPPEAAALVAEVEAWITVRGIKGHYETPEIAARVVSQSTPEFVRRHLDMPDSIYLRHMCRHLLDVADMDDARRDREERRHGHHGRGGPRRTVTGRAAA